MNEQELIQTIKQSKKYKHLSEEIIAQKVQEFTKRNPSWQDHKDKFILKEIKALLHKAYGSFQNKELSKRERYLEELKKEPNNKGIINKLLRTHNSTRERLEFYSALYNKIFELTNEPKGILDLGCGLNPLSVDYMHLKNNPKYVAIDISSSDKNLINKFFHIKGIFGKAETLDLTKIENIASLPNADICFMFKLVDILEREKKGHKYSEEIVKILIEKCEFLVISFATQTVGGKFMNFPERGWIERMLTRIGLKFKRLDFPNEIFYVVGKN